MFLRFNSRVIRLAICVVLATQSLNVFAMSEKQPNVLFIIIDDLRVQYGPYDIDQVRTPNIDSLTASGVAFGRAYGNVPICGASRASMLTGVRPTSTRFVTFESASKQTPWATTLPQHFKDNGYYSISLGKVFNNPGDKPESWSETEWRPNAKSSKPGVVDNETIMARHNYVTKDAIEIAQKGRFEHLAFEKANVDDDAYYNGQIANRAIADLKRLREMDTPFFLAVGLKKPHLPFNAPARYWDLYDEAEIQLTPTPLMPKNAPPQAMHNWGELRNYGHNGRMPKKGTNDLMPDDLARKLIHGYYAATSYSDALVGEILAELEDLGLSDDTIVVLWGDHGWSLGEHTQWAKHSSFNVVNQVPLIIKAPGMPNGVKGAQADGLVESVDIYPTLVELAGLTMPDHLQGESFRGMLHDPDSPGKSAVFPRWKNADSIRTDQYFYTEWRNDEGEVTANMLFDHHKDPMETNNLAVDEAYTPVIESLHGQLNAHIQSLNPASASKTREAARKLNQSMGMGNNFMAQKSMKNQGAKEDYLLLERNHFRHCRIGYKMNEVSGDSPGFLLPASNFESLQRMVDWCIAEGLIAVVNPIHNWTSTGFDNPDDLPKLGEIWKQVASHFAAYSLDNVVFEIINEPREDDIAKDIINAGLAAIRGIPGNEKRIVIVSGDGFSTRQALIDAFDKNELPANDPYLIGTFHYYDPRRFTKSSKKDWSFNWGDYCQFEQVGVDFDEVIAANERWAQRNSTEPLPIYLGEFGADNKIDNYSSDRMKWLSWVRMQAEVRQMSWAHWTMYSTNPGAKGIGPWTPLEQSTPSARTFNAGPLEALIGLYELEEAVVEGGTVTTDSISGTGYVSFPGSTKAKNHIRIESIFIPKTDRYTLQVRYASDEAHKLQITNRKDSSSDINKTVSIHFPATGGAGNWQTLDVPVHFEAGDSASLWLAGELDGGIALDWIRVTQTATGHAEGESYTSVGRGCN